MKPLKPLEELETIEQVLLLVQVNNRTNLAKAKVQLALCGRRIDALEEWVCWYWSHGTRRDRFLNRIRLARRHVLVGLREVLREKQRRQYAEELYKGINRPRLIG